MSDALYSSPDLLQEADRPLVDAALRSLVASIADDAKRVGATLESDDHSTDDREAP